MKKAVYRMQFLSDIFILLRLDSFNENVPLFLENKKGNSIAACVGELLLFSRGSR